MNHAGEKKTLRKAYERISAFLSPSSPTIEESSKRVLTGLIVIITCPVLLGYSFYNLFASRFLLAAVLFLSAIIVLVTVLVGRKRVNATPFFRFGLAGIGIRFLYLLGISESQTSRMFWVFQSAMALSKTIKGPLTWRRPVSAERPSESDCRFQNIAKTQYRKNMRDRSCQHSS